jgi:hypothetical protein
MELTCLNMFLQKTTFLNTAVDTKAILSKTLPDLVNSEIINMVIDEPLKEVLVHPFAPSRLLPEEIQELNKALGEILL